MKLLKYGVTAINVKPNEKVLFDDTAIFYPIPLSDSFSLTIPAIILQCLALNTEQVETNFCNRSIMK